MNFHCYLSWLTALTILSVLIILRTEAVKLQDFKRCDQSGFCRRLRSDQPVDQVVNVDQKSLQYAQGQIMADLVDLKTQMKMLMTMTMYQDGIVRVLIDERGGQRKRYQVENVLILDQLKMAQYERKDLSSGVQFEFGLNCRVVLHFQPFSIDYYQDSILVAMVNKNSQLRMEPSRSGPAEGEQWSESFKEFTDEVKHGPMAIGLDVTFPGSRHVYGIPEHAADFSLKETGTKQAVAVDQLQVQDEQSEVAVEQKPLAGYEEPYRLYNLDVFEYELDSPIALYGTVPLVWSHKKSKRGHSTAGFFLLNAAETWVDVKKQVTRNLSYYASNTFAKQDVDKDAISTTTHWMSETGVIDFSVLLGPSPKQVHRQYAMLTGSQTLPSLFSIAYHQCRWNYMSADEVREVNDGFERHDIPMDTIWLDIEHTDDKKYMTWDLQKFPDPKSMIDNVADHGRKMITIIDPHIKRADGYHVKEQTSQRGLFVKNKDGGEYDGWCWPGSSSWVDYCNPEARMFWAKLFLYSQYGGSTEALFTWNDMNEPSVFNGPEITMPKNNLHFQDVEHRDIHNIYGMLLHRATYAGHIARSLPSGEVSYTNWKSRTSLTAGATPHRPFILSRAFFAGTQRYGAIWTGDNMAKWDHLRDAVRMLLSVSLGGIGFCGADVGGFFGNPDAELLTRWYQAGAYYPFFRAHAHLDARRREPWLFGDRYTSLIREAIGIRYKMLPYWYTLFRRNQVDGVTPMRPMFMEFPNDASLFAEQDQYMLGDALMVKHIWQPISQGGNKLAMYLPGNDLWYNYHSHIAYKSQGSDKKNRDHLFSTPLDSPLPVLIRAGTIISTKERVRRSSLLMANDPLTLTVALNSKKESRGEYYLDDGESFMYAVKGEFVHKQLIAKINTQSLIITATDVNYDEDAKSKRMKPWQRPFLGEPGMVNDKDKAMQWEEIERVMTLASDSKYKSSVAVNVERIVILGTDAVDFGNLQKAIASNIVKISSVSGGQSTTLPANYLTVRLISTSTIHGEESASSNENVVAVYELTLKKPTVNCGHDWEVKIEW